MKHFWFCARKLRRRKPLSTAPEGLSAAMPRFGAPRRVLDRVLDIPHLRTRLHEVARKDLPPASWRHAAEWVDLELERVGLGREDGFSKASIWGSEEEGHIQRLGM